MEEVDRSVQYPWFKHWHKILDEVMGRRPDFDFEAAIADPDTNFRMHFVTWDLPDDDLRRCFSIFSCGQQMAERAIEFRGYIRGTPPEISDSQALDHAEAGVAGYASFVESEKLRKGVKVVRGTNDEIGVELSKTDSMHELLENMEWSDPLAPEIDGFLSETLYRLASSYDIAEYILWPLYVDHNFIDPQRHFAILDVCDRFTVRLAKDGPTLFITTD
ncbi:MAG: hypothetical protein AAGG48_32310 [Planctomycetota bacterium]